MTRVSNNLHICTILVTVLIFRCIPGFSQVTFQKVPILSLPDDPQELAKGDFNNDGFIDFVSANFNAFANQQVTLLLNTGSGTFSGINKRNFTSRQNALDIAVGDFNEDGNLDVVTISQENTNALSLLLGDGAGNLASPIFFNAGNTPNGIAVGDMNKDNHLDVLVTNRGTPDDVYIYLGDGTGGFSLPTIIAIANVWDITVADFNGDTNPDFAIYAGTAVQVWFGNGSGTSYTPGTPITGFAISAEDIIAAHLDDDADIDIMAAGGYILNDGAGNFGARIALSQTNYEYTVADVNGDAHPDIISNDNNSNRPHIRIFLGDGLGAFTLLAKFETTALAGGLEVADVNNDGLPDIVSAGSWSGGVGNADVLFGEGTGYFSNAILKYPTASDPRDMAKGDFNEDGEIDVALCHSVGNIVTVYLGQGDGKFNKTSTNHATGSFPSSMKVFDYNNDTHFDLVTLNQTSGSVTVLTGAGDGSFTALGNFNVTAIAGSRLEIADFNNDNIPDIAVSGFTNNFVNVLIGTGSGFNTPVTSAVSQSISEIKAADFNGDGNQDLAVDFNNIDRMVLLVGNGDGTFSEGTTQYPSAGSFFLAEDINSDSHMDVIAFTNNSLGSDYFINDGSGNFTGTSMPSSLGGFPWAFEDMDGDSFKDLVVGAQNSISSEPGQVLIFRGTSTGISTTLLIDHDLSGGNRLVVHDVNADGKPDVITTSFNIYEDYLGVLINTTAAPGCPTIVSQPNSVTACEGDNVSLSLSATGAATLTYQWRFNATDIPGAVSATLLLNGATVSQSGNYSCIVTNGCGSVTSNSAGVTVNVIPTAPTVVNASNDGCGTSSLNLTASSPSATQYLWYSDAGATNLEIIESLGSFNTPELSESVTYYVVAANGACESPVVPVTATISSPGPGAINTAFTPASNSLGNFSAVDDISIQPDGKIILNYFETGGIEYNLCRLLSTGDLDPSFNQWDYSLFSGRADLVALQNDGKIILAGRFTNIDGTNYGRIARFNADGNIDITFNSGQSGFNGRVRTVVIQADNKILVGGSFTTYNGIPASGIIRLNTDGTIDSGFTAGSGFDDNVNVIVLQSDGKILAGGSFTDYNGNSSEYLVRINTDGSFDAAFSPPVFDNTISVLAIQPDGKILHNGSNNGLGRLNIDGSPDNSFDAGLGVDDTIYEIITDASEKILISGWFQSYNGTNRSFLARLLPDGSIDNFFNPGIGSNSLVTDIILLSANEVMVAGYFDQWNNQFQNGLAIVNNECIRTPVGFGGSSCGTDITLTACGGDNGQYRWYDVASGGTPIAGVNNNTLVITDLSVTTTYYVSLYDGACESVRVPVVATFNSSFLTPPSVTAASSCLPASLTLTAFGGTDGNYRWYTQATGGSPLPEASNSAYTTPVLSATTTYYVSLVSGDCESARTPLLVTIGDVACTNQPPVLDIPSPSTGIQGSIVIDLAALSSDPDNNLDINSFKIITNPASGATAQIINGVLTVDYSGVEFSGVDQLTIEICDLLGSCIQEIINITVNGELIVYEGISPNSDGLNEKWLIQNINLLPDSQDNKVFIYNRWGDLVFEMEDYDNDVNSFIGISKNGNELPSGIYFYKVVFNSGRAALNGYLNLKR